MVVEIYLNYKDIIVIHEENIHIDNQKNKKNSKVKQVISEKKLEENLESRLLLGLDKEDMDAKILKGTD